MKSSTANPVRIEPASEADLEAIAKLAAVIWRKCYPGIITSEQIEYMLERMYALDTMREEMRAQGIFYDRLLVVDQFTGFAAYGLSKKLETFKLHKLYLHPDCHGRGVGSLLLKHCERKVRELGARRLILNVNKRNTRAIAAYERNGFSTIESVVADIGGGFLMDDYIMAKTLG